MIYDLFVGFLPQGHDKDWFVMPNHIITIQCKSFIHKDTKQIGKSGHNLVPPMVGEG